MAQVELIMPKMGESIMEATILKWVKNIGDTVEVDETILEIATDKVDSEIPSPVGGTIAKILFKENDVVEIGKVIAIIATEGEEITSETNPALAAAKNVNNGLQKESIPIASNTTPSTPILTEGNYNSDSAKTTRFYSPLVKSIAKKENVAIDELEQITGSGANNRVTKKDILTYISTRSTLSSVATKSKTATNHNTITTSSPNLSTNGGVEIIEMDRMRKLIADHMVMSKRTSPHVTSFIEVDVTNIVNWRNAHKENFQKTYGEKITFTPIFIEAVVQAIRDFPMINVSLDGQKIIIKKNINIGMATALPSGNLIVPVIKNADQINLIGLTKAVNGLAAKARANKLKPEDIQDGTFTLTNVGTFGNVMGTPIINQPQVAILAVGAIRKKPAVLETEYGDVIAIRQLMFMSLSYDHRVVDGFLGGSFLRKIGDYLESFDVTRKV